MLGKGSASEQYEEEEETQPNWEYTEIEPVNLTLLNESSISISLEGGNNRFEEDFFDNKSIEFTWNATK